MLAAICCLLLLLLCGGAHSHSGGRRERRGTSWRVDGRFDGFAPIGGGEDRGVPHAEGLGRPAAIRVNSTTLTASSGCAWAGACGTNGAWVEVSGSCGDELSDGGGWWVGLFPASAPEVRHVSPASLGNMSGLDPILSPPFVLPAPLKFQQVSCAKNLSKQAAGANPGAEWWVPRMASGPVVFVLLSGGAAGASVPVERARSAPIQFATPAGPAPMHIRLARAGGGGSSEAAAGMSTRMRVSWTSSSPAAPEVRWGTTPDALSHTVAGVSSGSYSPDDLCGEPARTLGWWEPGFMLSAVIDVNLRTVTRSTPLAAGDRVYYTVSSGGARSAVKSFAVTGVGPSSSVTAVLTADMGATTPDFLEQHWAENDAFATTNLMAQLVAQGFNGSPVSLALNVGDLSYATGYL